MTIGQANLGSYGPSIRRIQDDDELIDVRQSRHLTRRANAYQVTSFELAGATHARPVATTRRTNAQTSPSAGGGTASYLCILSAARALVLAVCMQILQKGAPSGRPPLHPLCAGRWRFVGLQLGILRPCDPHSDAVLTTRIVFGGVGEPDDAAETTGKAAINPIGSKRPNQLS